MAERASAHLWKGRAMPLTSAQLVEQVEAAARVIFAPRPFPLATREVKTFFGDLGRTLDFRICASGYKGADDGEWLYDLVWFESDEEGFMIRQALVLQTEGRPDLVLDGDFQKLVQARADLRVWITSLPNAVLSRQHVETYVQAPSSAVLRQKRRGCIFADRLRLGCKIVSNRAVCRRVERCRPRVCYPGPATPNKARACTLSV